MLHGLRQRRAPVGALGIRSHLRAGGPDSFGPGLARFILDVKNLGLAVYIT
jgi:endo-1,4-beta-xylanase